MRSLFIMGRHGETGLNESGKYRGWSNGPDAQLNEDGIKSAHEQGRFLKTLGQPITKIICSPLGRAEMTAAIVAGYVGIEKLIVHPLLHPLNVGDFAGKPKDENPLTPYLHDKDKIFPDGESINMFERRQHDFAQWLLPMVEAEKQEEDREILVIAHVSNVMYWWNLQTSANSDEYLSENTDIIKPGGLVMVTEHSTVPIFKPNEDSNAEGGPQKNSPSLYPPDHKFGMAVPEGGSNCAKCKFLAGPQKCGNRFFQKWKGDDKIPTDVNKYCCDVFEEKNER